MLLVSMIIEPAPALITLVHCAIQTKICLQCRLQKRVDLTVNWVKRNSGGVAGWFYSDRWVRALTQRPADAAGCAEDSVDQQHTQDKETGLQQCDRQRHEIGGERP